MGFSFALSSMGVGLAPSKGGGVAGVPVTRTMGVNTFTGAGLSRFNAWNGIDAAFVSVFGSHNFGATIADRWQNFNDVIPYYFSDLFPAYSGPRHWTIPLTVDGVSLATVAAGTYDANFTLAAMDILADAPADGSQIVIRLGHEFNFAGVYPHSSVGVESNYIAAFRRGHGLFRAVPGGHRFRFDWCCGIAIGTSENLALSYPGDDVVDIVGADIYYLAAHKASHGAASATAAAHFASLRALTYGLDYLVSFAAAHGKPLSIPEWGTDLDDPDWVTLGAAWIAANPVAYHAWFDNSADPNFLTEISDDSKFKVGEAFIAAYGVPTWGASLVTAAPNVDASYFDTSVTHSGFRVTGDGAVNYGARAFNGGAIPVGHYQVQALVKPVAPNTMGFANWYVDATPSDAVSLGFTANNLDYTYVPPGNTPATAVSMVDLPSGNKLLTFEVDVDVAGLHFYPGFGPGSATAGAATDFLALRVRPSA